MTLTWVGASVKLDMGCFVMGDSIRLGCCEGDIYELRLKLEGWQNCLVFQLL